MNNRIIAYKWIMTALFMFPGKALAIDSAPYNFEAGLVKAGNGLDKALQSILRRDPLV